MTTENLAVVESVTDRHYTNDQLELIRRNFAQGATDDELAMYVRDCRRQGADPRDRLIHFSKRGGKYTPITSIDFMRTRAADTGEYAGSADARFTGEPGKPNFAATVTVYRFVQGQKCEFTATARWSEYYPGDQGGHMWRKMPHTMTAKCAEALALRKGFPRQLAGLYAREELAQADSPATTGEPAVTTAKPTTTRRPPANTRSRKAKDAEPLENGFLDRASIADVEPRKRSSGERWWLVRTTNGEELVTLDEPTALELARFRNTDHRLGLSFEVKQNGEKRVCRLTKWEVVDDGEPIREAEPAASGPLTADDVPF